MGYYSTYGASKKDIIAEIVTPFATTEPVGTRYVTAKALSGNTLWTVEEVRDQSGAPLEKCIGLYLLRKTGEDWAYKPMSETVEPYFYDCPLRFLDMVPELRPAWRQKVRDWHAHQAIQRAKANSLALGQKWSLVGARDISYVVIGRLKPLSGQADNGRFYRIPPKMLGEMLEERFTPYATPRS